MTEVSSHTNELRNRLVSVALEWERIFGVEPLILSAVSEYDAARLVGHTDESYREDRVRRSIASYGTDFTFKGLRYHVKANQMRGGSASSVSRVSEARNYHWDRLVWILYDHDFTIQEAWEWEVAEYRAEFEGRSPLSVNNMRQGKRLK